MIKKFILINLLTIINLNGMEINISDQFLTKIPYKTVDIEINKDTNYQLSLETETRAEFIARVAKKDLTLLPDNCPDYLPLPTIGCLASRPFDTPNIALLQCALCQKSNLYKELFVIIDHKEGQLLYEKDLYTPKNNSTKTYHAIALSRNADMFAILYTKYFLENKTSQASINITNATTKMKQKIMVPRSFKTFYSPEYIPKLLIDFNKQGTHLIVQNRTESKTIEIAHEITGNIVNAKETNTSYYIS